MSISNLKDKVRDIPKEVRNRVRRKLAEPFSPFGSILPEEWWYWDETQWPEDEYIHNAASEAWNIAEFTESGYIAMKRMLSTLIDPNKESKDIDEFTQKLKELYDERRKRGT